MSEESPRLPPRVFAPSRFLNNSPADLDLESDGRAVAIGRYDFQLSAEVRRTPPHARQAFALRGPIYALAVIAHAQHQPSAFHSQIDRRFPASGMADDVVHGFLENQEDVPAHFRFKPELPIPSRREKLEFDIAAGEDVTGETTHPPGQI